MAKGIFLGDKKNIAQNVSAAYPSHKGIAIKAIAAFIGDINNKAVLCWGEAPNAIAFMIDGIRYYAEAGSTWAEWLNSTSNSYSEVEYNSSPCISKDGGKSFLADESGEFIKTTDTITDKGIYASYVPLTVDGTAIKVLAGTTWGAWATSNAPYGIYRSYISKDGGTTVVCVQNGDPVSADSVVSSGTYTSISIQISFKVDGTTYSVIAGTTWRTWVEENPPYLLAAEYIQCETFGRFYLCDSDGARVKNTDVITSGIYGCKYSDYWYEVVLMKDGAVLDTLMIGGSSSETGKVICDAENKTIKLVSTGEEDTCYLSQIEGYNVIGLYIYPREGDINTDSATEWTVNANVENTFNVRWDINSNECTHPAESIEIEQYDDGTHLCRCTEKHCGYEWLEAHSYDSNGKCTICGYVKLALCSTCGSPLSKCPSCGEVGWCSECVKCESCGNELTTKTFTIDGITYQFDTGMTWGEWVNSSMNTKPYYIVEGYVSMLSSVGADGGIFVAANAYNMDEIVSENDTIRASHYNIKKITIDVDNGGGSGGSSGGSSGGTTTKLDFSIDGTYYSVPVGADWQYFYNHGGSSILSIDEEGYLHNLDGDRWLVWSTTYTKCHVDAAISSTTYMFNELRESD